MAEHHIEAFDDIEAYRIKATESIAELKDIRDDLRNELKRVMRKGNESEILTIKEKIATVSGKITKFQESFAICDSVEERSRQMQQELEDINKQTEEKEVENDEQLFGRSSGTGRTDVTKRR